MKESNAKKILTQLLLGLDQIHGQNITHRDLRPSNIYINTIDSSEVRISSFSRALFSSSPPTYDDNLKF